MLLCKYPWSVSPRIFGVFFKINQDSFAASTNTSKYTREIRNVKEIRYVLTENLLDPMEVLHKQLSLKFAEQTD